MGVSIAALGGDGAAQHESQPSTYPDSEIHVTIKTVQEDMIRGSLLALSLLDGAVVRTIDADNRHIPTSDLVRVTTTAPASPRRPNDLTLALADGDVLYGRIVEGDGDGVMIETVDLGSVRVPLDSIEHLRTARASEAAYRESAGWFNRSRPVDVDQILLTNGDVADGFITAINADGISVEGTFGETEVPHRLVVVARLASGQPVPNESRASTRPGAAPSASDRPIRTRFQVTLRASGRVTVTAFAWLAGVVEADLLCGGHVDIEAVRITSIEVIGGRWEWLSRHHPISYEHTPMLSLDWGYARDRNVLGGPIRVAGRTFEHGVGVHSRSSLTYDLQGAYRELVTYFGIDDDSGPYADVSTFILVDGKRRFDQAHVRAGKLFGPVRLDVTRANRIELVVDFGDHGDVQDRLDWVEAALIR